MQRIFAALLFWTLILCACSTGAASPQTVPPPTATSFALPTTAALPTSRGCAFQWAYQDLPELSSSFEQSIQALQPEAQASALAYGENCIRPDGSVANFFARETDFDLILQVDDLVDEANLGKWIVQVMQVIENIPAGEIAGRGPGQVSIIFQSGTAQSKINFEFYRYLALPAALSNAEIYKALKIPQ
ncbi:MAG TPA: hypothetical protein VFQ13_00765 [Anaerolineales bacterium]|nr:hypothetical protein [Anaerolineales bacterium]